VTRYGRAASGGVRDYALDNEPELWFDTHRDVHPSHLGYDELVAKDTAVAAAIKAADPTARVVGPNGWGYPALFDLQFDTTSPSADKTAHGGIDVAQWFLSQMAAYAQSHGGTRILDTFDTHFYPAQAGVALAPAGSAATQALRLRSVRSLWDPTYLDESWITDAYGTGDKGHVRFIPRLHDFADHYYPGTKIGIGEYNFGGLESLNGALAQADVLGVFARERLDQATMWSPPHTAEPGAFAFRMFRNFDGAGASFGDTYVKSTSADQGKLSIYGAQRGANGALTVAVINKTPDDLTSPLSLANFNAGPSAQVFRYSGADLTRIVRQADVAVASGALSTTFPANSITMLVIPPAGPTAALSATPTSVVAGRALTVSWSGITAPTNADLVALYPSSSNPDTAHIAYRYTGGGASGTMALTVPANAVPGNGYELRLWSNNGAQRLATFGPLIVTGPPPPTLSATPTTVKAGNALTVSWANIAAPTNADLVALYPSSGTGDTAHIAYRYTGGAASGTLALTVPANAVPGNGYELRLWSNNGAQRLATFGPLIVNGAPPPTVSETPTTVVAGNAISVTWANIAAPTANDVILLYPSSSAGDTAWIAYRYTGGTAGGTTSLTVPATAAPDTTYELRLWSNNGAKRLAVSTPFTVTAAPPPTVSATPTPVKAGSALTVSWANIPAPTNADLVALYPDSSTGDTSHIAYRYTGGAASGTLTLTVPANALPGTTYEVRLWSNNGAKRLATSTPITVTK